MTDVVLGCQMLRYLEPESMVVRWPLAQECIDCSTDFMLTIAMGTDIAMDEARLAQGRQRAVPNVANGVFIQPPRPVSLVYNREVLTTGEAQAERLIVLDDSAI